MLIKEQMRKYKVKMEEINQLEAAESIAFRRLSLLRQNAVSSEDSREGLDGRDLVEGSLRAVPQQKRPGVGGAGLLLGGGRGLAPRVLPRTPTSHLGTGSWGLMISRVGAELLA